MGKKRIKGKTAQSDESLDTLEPVCKHIRKGLEQGHLKKALLNVVEWHVCQDCKADNKTEEKSEEETDESPSIWLCLKCGHRTGATYVIMKSSITLQPDWVRLWIMLENKLVLTHHIQ